MSSRGAAQGDGGSFLQRAWGYLGEVFSPGREKQRKRKVRGDEETEEDRFRRLVGETPKLPGGGGAEVRGKVSDAWRTPLSAKENEGTFDFVVEKRSQGRSGYTALPSRIPPSSSYRDEPAAAREAEPKTPLGVLLGNTPRGQHLKGRYKSQVAEHYISPPERKYSRKGGVRSEGTGIRAIPTPQTALTPKFGGRIRNLVTVKLQEEDTPPGLPAFSSPLRAHPQDSSALADKTELIRLRRDFEQLKHRVEEQSVFVSPSHAAYPHHQRSLPESKINPMEKQKRPMKMAAVIDVAEYRKLLQQTNPNEYLDNENKESEVRTGFGPSTSAFSFDVPSAIAKSDGTRSFDTKAKNQLDEKTEALLTMAKKAKDISVDESVVRKARDIEDEIQIQRLRMQKLLEERQNKGKKDDPDEEFLAPLTTAQQETVDNAWSSRAHAEIICKVESFDLTRGNLLTLRGKGWLDDEVINAYMRLLFHRNESDIESGRCDKMHFFNTHFYTKLTDGGYTYRNVKRWTSSKKIDYKISKCHKVIVPVHKGVHWTLAVINLKDKKISFMDSMSGSDITCCKNLLRYLGDEMKDKDGDELDANDWHLEPSADVPQQNNGYDCGVFLCKFADYSARNAEMNFSSANMQYFRQRICADLCAFE